MTAIQPAMSAEDASQRLNLAFVAENPDCYATLSVDANTLSDVLDKGEAQKIQEYIVGVEKLKAKKARVMHTRDTLVNLSLIHI